MPETYKAGATVDEVRVRLTWLLVFRAVVITVLFGTALFLRATSDESLYDLIALGIYGVAFVGYASIIAGAIWLRRFGARGVRGLAYVQLIVDAMIASVLVLLTGGVESVFTFVYSLTVLNAAAVLERYGAAIVAVACLVLFAGVAAVELSGVLRGLLGLYSPTFGAIASPFLTSASSFFLIAALGGYLTGQLTRTTERLATTEAELRRLERLHAFVLASLPSGVVTIAGDGSVVYANDAGGEILGEHALVGRKLHDVVPGLGAALHAQHDAERFELSHAVPGRGARTIGGSIAPLQGVGAGEVLVLQDLTELRRLQNAVLRSERLAELGRFAAGLAHEVRNPLAAMIGCLQLLHVDARAGKPWSDDDEKMIGIVQREAERLSRLVSDFLTFARPAPPQPAAVDVRALCDEVALASRSAPGSVVVEVEGDAHTALVDGGQLSQVLWNLVQNAREVLAERTDGRVHLRVSAREDAVVIHVDDNGPGVPPELRDRIFEPFFTTRPSGTGLGLATCQILLRQQGADIDVNDAPSGGARFEVRLPRAQVDEARARVGV